MNHRVEITWTTKVVKNHTAVIEIGVGIAVGKEAFLLGMAAGGSTDALFALGDVTSSLEAPKNITSFSITERIVTGVSEVTK